MKKILRYMLVAIFALGVLQSSRMFAKKCNDLILLFDPYAIEETDGKSLALGFKLVDALQEKACPVLLSRNLLENFCFWKTQNSKILNQVKQEALKTKNIKVAEEKAVELLAQLKESEQYEDAEVLNFFSVTLSATDLSDNDWHCYSHKEMDLVLLIPKNYITRRVAPSVAAIDAQIEECGFSVAHLDKIDNLFPKVVLNYIKAHQIDNPIDLMDAVESMFITEKAAVDGEELAIWNMYVNGHGGPALKKKVVKERLAKEQQELEEAQSNPKDESAGDIEDIQGSIKRLSGFLKVAENLSDEAIIPQSATVAGLDFDEFVRLMNFFNSSIATSFVHYSTCFGGGYNQIFINDVLQKLKVDFIVSSQGSSESFTHSWIPKLEISANGSSLVLSRMRFADFFTKLGTFFGDQTAPAGTKVTQEAWEKDPIAAIVSSIMDTDLLAQNQPFVRIPAVGVFNALTVDKQIKILTNSLVKAHEFEGRVIDFANSDIKTIVVYPTHVGVSLKMTGFTNVISPTPQKVEQTPQSVHIFEEIITDQFLRLLIFDFVNLNSSYSKITFVIKKLVCSYSEAGLPIDKPIENMIINIAGDLSSKEVIDADVAVMFTIDGQAYSFSEHIEHFADNAFNVIDTVTFSPTTPAQLEELGAKILEQKDMAALKGRPITTAALVEQFDKKIDRTFGVQKPGALKKNLLLQQLESLEKATNSQEVARQKKWLEENKKPAITFTSSLSRYKKDLERLKGEIDQLAVPGELSPQERDAIQKRVEAIQEKIAKEFVIAAAMVKKATA